MRRDSIIADVLESRPDAARVLHEEFDLPCYDCEAAFTETIEEGVSLTGLDPDVVVARLCACPPAVEKPREPCTRRGGGEPPRPKSP